jgi:hypothetical protein
LSVDASEPMRDGDNPTMWKHDCFERVVLLEPPTPKHRGEYFEIYKPLPPIKLCRLGHPRPNPETFERRKKTKV